MAALKASRFALLKVEDDEEDAEMDAKPNQQGGHRGNQQSTGAKRKNKKKKQKDAASENAQLRNLAFGSAKGGKHRAPGRGGGDVPEAQWDEWEKRDKEYTADAYEKDLQQALLLSKLEHEQTKDKDDVRNGDDSGVRSGAKDKKKKKKEKPSTMSLEQFNQLPVQEKTNEDSGDEIIEVLPAKPKLNTQVSDPDPKFFDKVDDDVTKIIRKEKIQDEYRKQYAVDNVRTAQYQEELDKRDKEIETLQEENSKLEEELKQVKKRNAQLCHILSQGEMKDKKSVLVELEQLKSVRDELTQEVASLTSELEKERSQVHTLKEELSKETKGGKETTKESSKGKGGKHGSK